MKWFFAGLGGLFFSIGVVGAFLPVLPTTPFMLLALWAFSLSSERLHNYLWNHPKFGPPVRAWRKHGAVSMRSKISALAVMSASAVFMIFFSNATLIGILAALALMAVGAAFLLTRPTLRPELIDESEQLPG